MMTTAEQRKLLPLNQIRIDDAFWNRYTRLVTEEIIPYQYRMLCDLEESHCIENFRIAAGLAQGDFQGHVFQDTDLAKWLEAVAYSLAYAPDEELEATADALIELVGMAQEDNGYLDTYFTIRHPGKQFCNLKEGHELYTAGHFIEAAVAYYQVTGKDRFLKIVCACADNICRVFRQPDYLDAVPGHEEIELALVKLTQVTGNQAYADMALEFVNRRGTTDYLSREHKLQRFVDCWHDRNPYHPPYGQAHKPVREQEAAEGHAVRALYLFTAMADLAQRYEDQALLEACERLYENITQRRMYLTGGIGSSGVLERFTTDFDLPNDTAYAESCASIALAMFCRRMARITGDSKYMDTAELALMNTVLAGVALDGKRFFYVNPLEVVPRFCMGATDKAHVKPVRQKWFGCACCPPNIARTLASLGDYTFLCEPDALWIHMYISGIYQAELAGQKVMLRIDSQLPWNGSVSLTMEGIPVNSDAVLRLRIPDYAENFQIFHAGSPCGFTVDQGYAVVRAQAQLRVEFQMPAKLIFADPRLAADAGKCAVKKGPLVYCLEQQDNGENLAALLLDPRQPLKEQWQDTLGGTVVVTAQGLRMEKPAGTGLYSTDLPLRKPVELRFVPYCFWGNRTPGEMAVWVKYSGASE